MKRMSGADRNALSNEVLLFLRDVKDAGAFFKPRTHDCNKEEVSITASHNFHGKPFKMKLRKFESGNVRARRNFVRRSLYLTLATAHSSIGC